MTRRVYVSGYYKDIHKFIKELEKWKSIDGSKAFEISSYSSGFEVDNDSSQYDLTDLATQNILNADWVVMSPEYEKNDRSIMEYFFARSHGIRVWRNLGVWTDEKATAKFSSDADNVDDAFVLCFGPDWKAVSQDCRRRMQVQLSPQ